MTEQLKIITKTNKSGNSLHYYDNDQREEGYKKQC